MEAARFDAIARALARRSRRQILRAVAAAGAAVLIERVGRVRSAQAANTLPACRPPARVFPDKPSLLPPFRAVTDGDASACAVGVSTRNVVPRVMTRYGAIDTHVDPFYNAYYALDFGTSETFPVLAAAGGMLQRHDEGGGVGLYVKHNEFWLTKYLHLSECELIEDPATKKAVAAQNAPFWVDAGTMLGWAGNPGEGTHLHFELRGGDAAKDQFSSFAVPDCCTYRNCNWSYPVQLPGVAIPSGVPPAPDDAQTCPSSAQCKNLPANQPAQRVIACCPATPIKPGGLWIRPDDGALITDPTLRLAANAYPTKPDDPPIDHVNFTIWWPDVGPRNGPWKIACAVRPPSQSDVFTCDADLAALGAPQGQPLTISFDVYDRDGNYNLAPHGLRTVTWRPDLACPGGQIRCNGVCVDPKKNPEHCGACDNRCGIFQICCAGECGCDGSVIVPGWCMDAAVIC